MIGAGRRNREFQRGFARATLQRIRRRCRWPPQTYRCAVLRSHTAVQAANRAGCGVHAPVNDGFLLEKDGFDSRPIEFQFCGTGNNQLDEAVRSMKDLMNKYVTANTSWNKKK